MSDYSPLPSPIITSEKEILDEAYRILNTSLETDILRPDEREKILGLLNGENIPYGINSSSFELEDIFEILSKTATSCFFCSQEIEKISYIKKYGNQNPGFSKNLAESVFHDITGRNMEMLFPVFMLPNIDSIDVRESALDGEYASIMGTVSLALSHPTSLGKALVGDAGYSIFASVFNKKMRKLVSMPVPLSSYYRIQRGGSRIKFNYKINTECSHLTVEIRQDEIPKESLYQYIRESKKLLIREVMRLSAGSAFFHIIGLQEIKRLPVLPSHGYRSGSSNFSFDLSGEYESKHTRAAAEILTLEYRKHIESQVKAMNNMELLSDMYVADFVFRKQNLFSRVLPSMSNVLGVPDVFWENTPKRKLYRHLKNILSTANLANDVETYRKDIPKMVIKEERANRTLMKPV